ncbi:MAG: hypothetical protein KY454_05530 [Actinobacteria bacterium]|nr:hypothetical protein [Actinomycetota bacterium]MBW3650819.1 hypothetical protein [Actinomycetota bacterium]
MSTRPPLTALALGLSILLVAACGSAEDRVLRATDDKLRSIDSGRLSLSVTGAATGGEGAGAGGPVGFRLEGPFSFRTPTPLPVARLTYTRLLGKGRQQEGTFISTGTAAFVETDGDTFEIPEEQVRGLALDPKPGERSSGLEQLRLSSWVDKPEVAREGDTAVVTGRLDAAQAFQDLAALARQLGVPETQDLQQLGNQDRQRLERLVESSSVRIVSGHEDHVLRELELSVNLRPGPDPEIRQALGRLGGARLDIRLSLAEVNQPVQVEAPAKARPLPGG